METLRQKGRIWEIDALRGLLIPGMVMIHLIYDEVDLYRFVDWPYPLWYYLFKNNYGALFVALAGLSVTLGSRPIRRGLTVFGGGMICTVVTLGMYLLNMADYGIIIYFGVLHCLGVCMMLWPMFRKMPKWALVLTGLALILTGWWLRGQSFPIQWLIPIGITFPGFASSDYFPLMPNLGYFLVGAALGKHFYCEKVTRFPGVNANRPVIRFFRFCGRHSLLIYLLHQPLLAIGCELFVLLKGL